MSRYTKGTWRRVKNVHGTNAPAGAFLKMSSPGIDTTRDVLTITRPDGDDLPNVLIASEEIPAGGYGVAYETGTIPLLWNGTTPAVDDRVGSQTNSWYGKVSDSGTHLVRAISGGIALGFFTPPGEAAITRVYINEWAVVDDSSPNSTFDYLSTTVFAPRIRDWYGTSYEKELFCKFESTVSGFSTPLVFPLHLVLGGPNTTYPAFLFSGVTGGDTYVHAYLYVALITADFTCSAVTWNNTRALAQDGPYESRRLVANELRDNGGISTSQMDCIGRKFRPGDSLTGSNIYGVRLYYGNTRVGDFAHYDFNNAVEMKGVSPYNDYRGYLEWGS